MPSISFVNQNVKNVLSEKQLLKKFIVSIFFDEGKSFQLLTFVFCSDDHLLTLNQQYLNHDYYTDILTFDLSVSEAIVSDIFISIDRVHENSKTHNVLFQQELVRVIFHGILHLCGYGDKTVSEKKIMTKKEDEYLEKYAAFHVKP